MTTTTRIRLLLTTRQSCDADQGVVSIPNDADPLTWREQIETAVRVELCFPNFTDGRAYSQAYLIRRRLCFKGDLRATGEVLADQLVQMERTGFSSAVLKDGVEMADALRQLERFSAFYQGDVTRVAPFQSPRRDQTPDESAS